MRLEQENAHQAFRTVTGTKETLNKWSSRPSKATRKPGLWRLWVICAQSLPDTPDASILTFRGFY